MLPFLHGRKQSLAPLISDASGLLVAYTRAEFDFAERLETSLRAAAGVFETAGASSLQNEFLSLLASAASAREGVNPYTLEHVSVRRRAMQRAVGQKVLQSGAELLRREDAKCEAAIEDGRQRLMPIVLNALQRSLFQLPSGRAPTQAELEQLWETLLADGETQSAARYVAMTISAADILILLGDLLATLTA